MAMKKWAMVIMNAGYDPEKDMARLDLEQVETHILTVRNPEEAVALAKRLGEEGFGAIEVCGAFGEELAKKMYEATGCKVPENGEKIILTAPPSSPSGTGRNSRRLSRSWLFSCLMISAGRRQCSSYWITTSIWTTR